MTENMSGRTVVVAGSTSSAGIAVVNALAARGARVAAVDLFEDRVRELETGSDNVSGYVCNLADGEAVGNLASRIRNELGAVDGLIHLVGGWRAGHGIAGQSDEDWDFLHTGILSTLRNTSRCFYDDLTVSPVGRLAIRLGPVRSEADRRRSRVRGGQVGGRGMDRSRCRGLPARSGVELS